MLDPIQRRQLGEATGALGRGLELERRIAYSGAGTYNASLQPVVLGGLAPAALVGLVVFGFLWRASQHPVRHPG